MYEDLNLFVDFHWSGVGKRAKKRFTVLKSITSFNA